ncbi:hypothetical protein [Saccharopolyspora halophila]|uniref:hypothetical protein n=1 Tax=Saccharopolyspora halophila TaxID=405551 RepID=UPI0031DBF044
MDRGFGRAAVRVASDAAGLGIRDVSMARCAALLPSSPGDVRDAVRAESRT